VLGICVGLGFNVDKKWFYHDLTERMSFLIGAYAAAGELCELPILCPIYWINNSF